jgi:hypothetical protein
LLDGVEWALAVADRRDPLRGDFIEAAGAAAVN